MPENYQHRIYQQQFNTERFKPFQVVFKETELWVGIDPLSFKKEMEGLAVKKVHELRSKLDAYLSADTGFGKSLKPCKPSENAPSEAFELWQASQKAGVGPMAAVAGLFAQKVGEEISKNFSVNEMVIENGGDLYLMVKEDLVLSVFAGKSPLSEKVGIKIPGSQTPIGVCTSAGTVGPSLSFGKADAVVVACKNTLEADAFATALANQVKSSGDIPAMLKSSEEYRDILSVLGICEDKIGIRGNFEVIFLK